jgi:hypothetical protein
MAKLALIDVNERRAEAPHGLVKKQKGFSKAGPVQVASKLRYPEFEYRLHVDPSCFKSLAATMDKVHSPYNVAVLLGLVHHKDIQELRRAGKEHKYELYKRLLDLMPLHRMCYHELYFFACPLDCVLDRRSVLNLMAPYFCSPAHSCCFCLACGSQ